MTQVVTVRLPNRLAEDLKATARRAGTTPSAVLRRFATEYVKAGSQPHRNALQEHILTHAGSWDGYCSGIELLRKTRP